MYIFNDSGTDFEKDFLLNKILHLILLSKIIFWFFETNGYYLRFILTYDVPEKLDNLKFRFTLKLPVYHTK